MMNKFISFFNKNGLYLMYLIAISLSYIDVVVNGIWLWKIVYLYTGIPDELLLKVVISLPFVVLKWIVWLEIIHRPLGGAVNV